MEVRNIQAAQKAVKKGAELSALLASAVTTRDQQALAVQQRFGGTISQYTAEINAIETALADWARGDRIAFAGKQSLEFPCGVLAFRAGGRSCELLPKWTWETVLQAARRLISWRKYVRIKFEINKQLILSDSPADGAHPKLRPERLKRIGLAIVRGPEIFEVEFRLLTKLEKTSC